MKASVKKLDQMIVQELAGRFPDFPITVLQSPSDDHVLCVRVFAVPQDRVGEVKTFVRQLEGKLCGDNECVLLPMVKNLEVTRQHYPEHTPVLMAGAFAASLELSADDSVKVWQVKSVKVIGHRLIANPVSVGELAFPTNYRPNNAPSFHSRRPAEEAIAANQELALAA